MGVNFTALYFKTFNIEELNNIPNTLQNDTSLNNLLASHEQKCWEWLCDEDELLDTFMYFGSVTLVGPNDMKIEIGKHLCELFHTTRWEEFRQNNDIQMWLRKVCFRLSKVFGNPIYIPQIHDCISFVVDEKDEIQIEHFLKTSIGDGKAIQAISSSRGNNHYFFDDFHDVNC